MYLIPRRKFGQGRKIPIFGHAETKTASKYGYVNLWPFLFTPIFALVTFYMVDWRGLKDKYGFDIGNIFKRMQYGGPAGRHVRLRYIFKYTYT